MTISVAIADDHNIVRAGYKRFFSFDPNIYVIAEFNNGEETYKWFKNHHADILIMDISMPGQGGLETLRKLKSIKPRLKIIMLSMHDSAGVIRQALDNGADGFLSKSSEPEELIEAIHAAMNGSTVPNKDMGKPIKNAHENVPHEELSQKEFIVLMKLAEGMTPKEISDVLNISDKTVYNYQTKIYKKLNVENGIQLIQYIKEHQLLQ